MERGSLTSSPTIGLRSRVRVLSVAEQLVEHDADREQVRGDVPPCVVGVGGLVRRRARQRLDGIADSRGDVEVEQLRPVPGQHDVAAA